MADFGYWLARKVEEQCKLNKLIEKEEFLNSALRILNGLHIGIDEGANQYHFDMDDVEYTEKYVKNMLSDIEKDMKENFPDPKEMPEFNDNNKFQGKKYSKPEINYGYQHEEFILPSDPNNKSGKDMSIKALQDLQNNLENSKYSKGLKTSGTYESQLDRFVRKYPGLK